MNSKKHFLKQKKCQWWNLIFAGELMPTFGNKVAIRIFLLLKIRILPFSKKTLARKSALLIN
jgi:hypothetical protein